MRTLDQLPCPPLVPQPDRNVSPSGGNRRLRTAVHGRRRIVKRLGCVDEIRGATAMSVAFRREGDDEHLEPTFELPIPPGPNLVTARGLALIEQRAAAAEARLGAVEGDEARKKALRDARYWRQ